MSIIVVWLRNEKIYKAQACGPKSWRRTANSWNEYAQLWNRRFGYDKNVVGTISESAALKLVQPHTGLPTHASREFLKKQRTIRELMRIAPWGHWKN
jgi:hypothetical protein